MAYADHDFYNTSYLTDEKAAVPWQAWSRYSLKADAIIDRYTQNRVAHVTDDGTLEKVKMCSCEIAELLYCADQMGHQAYESGAPGLLSSYSNDGQSGTFDTENALWTEDAVSKRIVRAVRTWLATTGLLYSGVACSES